MKALPITQPCTASWEDMRPVDWGRHCAACDNAVFDLSRASEARVQALIALFGASGMCVRQIIGEDGELVLLPQKTPMPPRRARRIVASNFDCVTLRMQPSAIPATNRQFPRHDSRGLRRRISLRALALRRIIIEMRHVLAAVVAVLAFANPVFARDWPPREDQEIVALDLRTGALKWTHKGAPLSHAHFERYADLLAAYPHYDQADKSDPMLLDPKTGQVVADTRDAKKPVKASFSQMIKGPIVLSNGWRLDNFDAGNTQRLEFVDPKTHAVAWAIDPAEYPEYVLAYKDLALVAYGYLTNQAVIFAYRAGTQQPVWRIDFNKLLHKPAQKEHPQRLGRVAPQIIDDVLYLQTGEHLFKVDPLTGKIGWRRDAAASLGIKYEPDLYGGALDIAVFSRDGDVLVVSFEKRILALRASTGALLWSMIPDTFPHSAFPLAADGMVYISSGPKRTAASASAKTTARSPE